MQGEQGVFGTSVARERIREAIGIQNRHTHSVMEIEGVAGIGTGIGADGQPVIRVFTERAGIPALPHNLEGVPVEVTVTGKFIAYADPTTRFDRPVPIGVSTGHPDITAGTIGARVKDLCGNVYALSNNHVYANQNEARIGDSALQPGAYDGGTDPADKIGELYNFEPINWSILGSNTIDAAIAVTTTDMLGNATPEDGYGTPSSQPVAAALGMPVQKYGRTTRLTHGQVSAINVTAMVCYDSCDDPLLSKYAWFDDQISITSDSEAFSMGGDSGSLIVTDDSNKNPVGLLFAGSETDTLANRIDLVLARFGVTIDDESTSGNNPPAADFSHSTVGLIASFTDQSTDSDGTIVAWSWDFGDGYCSILQNPTHTYTEPGTYNVALTVTDDNGGDDSASSDVTVSDSSGSCTINLVAVGVVKGRPRVELTWSGATSALVDIYRGDRLIATTENVGSYKDVLPRGEPWPLTYEVCENGNSGCCDVDTVTF
ncbi:PKD domain-containing protein [Thermodesulfobacteriota bacterium]